MLKSPVQKTFDVLVSEVIWPRFKNLGYRKTGNNFRFYSSAGWGKIVNLQKSAFGDQNTVRFTINTGLYLADEDRLRIGRAAEARFLEPDCLIRKRVGFLNGEAQDLWYELTAQTEIELLQQQVMRDVEQAILPYLSQFQSLDDILRQLSKEPYSKAAVQALFIYGYKQEAFQSIDKELATTIYRVRRQELEKLRATLTSDFISG